MMHKAKLKYTIILFSTILMGLLACKTKPNELKFEYNILKGMEVSKAANKPMLIHFTGYGSMGYNEFMDDLITSNRIHDLLNDDFITVQLYTDDADKMKESDTLNLYKINFSKNGQKRLKKSRTIGNVNNAIQIELLNINSQPQYLIADSDLNFLVDPFSYTGKNFKLFISKLEEGKEIFDERR